MQEQFSYSLMASGLGILIVFGILVLLSGLMILIRYFSDSGSDKVKISRTKVSKAATSKGVPLQVLVAVASTTAEGPEWVASAVAAYLAFEEDEEVTPQAGNWSSAGPEKYDPWIANNTFF